MIDQTNAIAELEHENRLLRARNERLQAMLDSIVPRLESACGKAAMPPRLIHDHINDPAIEALMLQAKGVM
jgi:hypothetical protein